MSIRRISCLIKSIACWAILASRLFLSNALLHHHASSPRLHRWPISYTPHRSKTPSTQLNSSLRSQLEQLSEMTTLSIDSGDLLTIEEYAKTGFITDSTTNPLFVSQAGLSGDPLYAKLVDDAVEFARTEGSNFSEKDVVSLAIDRLAVNLGAAIAKIVPGYISTEVDPSRVRAKMQLNINVNLLREMSYHSNRRLSFDTKASLERARRLIRMYGRVSVPRCRVLIKLAATWEGILAAEILEKEGVQCNLTLIFSVVQAIACAQRGIHLVSPFPGRILDWHNNKQGRTEKGVDPETDEGVAAVRKMYNYFKCHNHDTICMPASWRPSRGAGYELDEILALAGVDRMTIPASILEKLASSTEKLSRKLTIESARRSGEEVIGNGRMDEKEFRYKLNQDGCGTDKLAEGIRAFIAETEKLESSITKRMQAVSPLKA